jgi:hypothetical protein
MWWNSAALLCIVSFFILFFFWWYRGLNSSFHSFYADALQLEPLHQPFFVLGIFKIGSQELFAWAGFEPQSS